MPASQYISVRETAQILSTSEKMVMDLIEQNKLQAYKIANKFLRLNRSEVFNLRSSGKVISENNPIAFTTAEKIKDFFYYNDFYILAYLIIIGILYVIFYK